MPAQLAEPERRFTLSPGQIAAINPNTKTAPIFRSRADADLTAKIYYRVPVLINEAKGRDGNPWRVDFLHSNLAYGGGLAVGSEQPLNFARRDMSATGSIGFWRPRASPTDVRSRRRA